MRMIIEAGLEDESGSSKTVELFSAERSTSADSIGLTLAEGRSLMARTQQYFVRAQCLSLAEAHSYYEYCDTRLSRKGWHQRQIRTVYGRVTVPGPRLRRCSCERLKAGSTFSP